MIMPMRLTPLLFLAFFALPSPAEPPKREAEIKKAIATHWEKLATWCAPRRLLAEAAAAADEALAVDAGNAKAAAAKKAAEKDGPEATEGDRKEYEKKLEATRKAAAGLWKTLATEPHEDKEQAAYDAHWGKALELDPKGIAPAHEAEARAAMGKKDWARAARLLAQEERWLPPDEGRAKCAREAEARVSTAAPLLKKASTHEMRYFLMLPEAWTAGRTWPVLVVCEGAGAGYEAQCARHAGFRKDVPVILVTPCTFSNTNGTNRSKYPWYPESVFEEVAGKGPMAFDDPGIMAALEDVRRDWNAEEKYFITGFSGGGIVAWTHVFARPERLRGAFLANANFAGAPRETPEGGRDVVIRAFQGADDGHIESLTRQWNHAEQILKERGFTDYTRTLLPKVGHTACHQPVFDAIRGILEKSAK
jgi:predicted esterase